MKAWASAGSEVPEQRELDDGQVDVSGVLELGTQSLGYYCQPDGGVFTLWLCVCVCLCFSVCHPVLGKLLPTVKSYSYNL